jgi:hypothetical protein
MAQPFPVRRASVYRQRAQQLTETAVHEWREDVRRHMLDQAATFQRAADAMAPASEATERDLLVPPIAVLLAPRQGLLNGVREPKQKVAVLRAIPMALEAPFDGLQALAFPAGNSAASAAALSAHLISRPACRSSAYWRAENFINNCAKSDPVAA